MQHNTIIHQLNRNAVTFQTLLEGQPEAVYRWKPAPDKWRLLEIVCHLCNEEREDFRTRVRHVLETPAAPMPSIDPIGWVTQRGYLEQDYHEMVQKFLTARQESVHWLRSLKHPSWENVYEHPKLGPMSANLFLSNWLAHDLLHFRQINWLRYAYLQTVLTTEPLDYAGNW
jgi:hypothetical protein